MQIYVYNAPKLKMCLAAGYTWTHWRSLCVPPDLAAIGVLLLRVGRKGKERVKKKSEGQDGRGREGNGKRGVEGRRG